VRFSRKRQDGSETKIFSGFKRKHLFITTCIEKQCTRSRCRYSYYFNAPKITFNEIIENIASLQEKRSLPLL